MPCNRSDSSLLSQPYYLFGPIPMFEQLFALSRFGANRLLLLIAVAIGLLTTAPRSHSVLCYFNRLSGELHLSFPFDNDGPFLASSHITFIGRSNRDRRFLLPT